MAHQWLAAIAAAGGKTDIPGMVINSPDRGSALECARSILATLKPNGTARVDRHVLPAVDPGKHSTWFSYEHTTTSILVDLSQSEVARCAALDWLAPIAGRAHIWGVRRCIVLHCADMLSTSHKDALKKIIESSQAMTLFILTVTSTSHLPSAIVSRCVTLGCPGAVGSGAKAGAGTRASVKPSRQTSIVLQGYQAEDLIRKALASVAPASASRAAKDAAAAFSRLPYGPHVMVSVMRCLSENANDHECCAIIQDLAAADVLLARSPRSCEAATVYVTLHRAILASCVRRVKKKR